MNSEIEESVAELRIQGASYREIMGKFDLPYHKVQKILTIKGLTEPHYKYKRDDVIRKPELDEIFQKAGRIEYLGLPGLAWQCFTAVMWLYGKRVSEVIGLKPSDVYTDDEYLSIRFHVLKKRGYRDPGIKRPFTKMVTLENEYTAYIIVWQDRIKEEPFLFPRPQTKMGHIYRQYAHNVLKKIDSEISSHLFRHSLATQMAEKGATAYELINWFDWERTDTALEYIRRSGRMTEKLSNRKW